VEAGVPANERPAGSKITGVGAAAELPAETATVTAIVKVREPGYVPCGFRVRARIDETLFTAECEGAALRAVEGDERVESVALRQRLQRV
jgi:hypothetical protein